MTNKKSEFEKRIETAYLANGYLNPSEIKTMIEDAKAEFPIIEVCDTSEALKIVAPTWQEISEKQSQKLWEIETWFKKWCGNFTS